MNIALLPLDSRPCTAAFPVQLLACAGYSCIAPPLAILDDFTKPSKSEDIAAFIEDAAQRAGVLILAVEQLVFGSLLASREDGVSQAEAERRMSWLADVKARHPALRIVASSVVMRASISALCEQDLAAYHAMTEYSQAYHRAQLSGDAAQLAQAEAIAATIPAHVLDKYRRVRQRNHRVNRLCLAWTEKGIFEQLLLLQEDAQPLGFHRLEQAALREEIAALGIGDRVTLHNGTDEAGCLCAARVAGGAPLALHVHVLGGKDGRFIAKYEDRPFMENIESHCRFAGISLVPLAQADKVLCVLAPDDGEQDDVPRQEPEEYVVHNAALAAELAEVAACGKPVGLLDVRYANGGSLSFAAAVAEHLPPMSLAAYAAWNTASNALGTILAQLVLGKDAARNDWFTAERYLDDLIYESDVRFRLRDRLEAVGEDSLALVDKSRADGILQELMQDAAQKSPTFCGYTVDFDSYLPWPRTFEAAAIVRSVEKEART